MYKDLMPIGSIVRLHGGDRRVMICGRVLCRNGGDIIYDYVACLYPQGIMSSDDMYFFNRDAIEEVFFIGFQDQEEMQFRKGILDNLGELTVVDGQIVSKE